VGEAEGAEVKRIHVLFALAVISTVVWSGLVGYQLGEAHSRARIESLSAEIARLRTSGNDRQRMRTCSSNNNWVYFTDPSMHPLTEMWLLHGGEEQPK
jgi:hypothetical protein